MNYVAKTGGGIGSSFLIGFDDSLWATGDNACGQLGDNTTINKTLFFQVLTDVSQVAGGYDHSLALKTDNSLWGTGYNYWGQLADQTTVDVHAWKQIESSVVQFAAGVNTSLMTKTGRAFSTGRNNYGQFGDGNISNYARVVWTQSMYTDTTAPDISLSVSGLTVTANITDAGSGVYLQKWASGNQAANYFTTGGTYFPGNTFTVPSLGTYTVYAKDFAGNESVKIINVPGKISIGSDDLFGVTYGNGQFVAVGWRDVVYTSPNGTTWTKRRTYGDFNSVTYGNGLYVAVGRSGIINTSTDGVAWTQRTSGTTRSLNRITYNGTLFVAVGDYGTIVTSSDGITWTARTSGLNTHLRGIDWVLNKFVATGAPAKVTISNDGITWTVPPIGHTPFYTYYGTVPSPDPQLPYMIYGQQSATAVSESNMYIWVPITGYINFGDFRRILNTGGQYIAVTDEGGYTGKVVTGTDGTNWTFIMNTDGPLRDMVFGNNMYIAVGRGGVWLVQ